MHVQRHAWSRVALGSASRIPGARPISCTPSPPLFLAASWPGVMALELALLLALHRPPVAVFAAPNHPLVAISKPCHLHGRPEPRESASLRVPGRQAARLLFVSLPCRGHPPWPAQSLVQPDQPCAALETWLAVEAGARRTSGHHPRCRVPEFLVGHGGCLSVLFPWLPSPTSCSTRILPRPSSSVRLPVPNGGQAAVSTEYSYFALITGFYYPSCRFLLG